MKRKIKHFSITDRYQTCNFESIDNQLQITVSHRTYIPSHIKNTQK